MSRARLLPAGLLIALTTVSLLAAGLVTTPVSAAPDPKIWGVVLDGKGRPLLNVAVTAVDEDGEIVASDASYEGGDGEDSPRMGYFQLFPGSNGIYKVTLKKKGYATKRFSNVKIGRGQRVHSLGDITLRRMTEASGKLVKKSIIFDRRGRVKVTVTPAKERPTGRVEVRFGKKVVGSGELKAKDRGELTITLKRLDKGRHGLKVVYAGSKFHAGSTSDKFTLKVNAAKKSRQRPNALAILG